MGHELLTRQSFQRPQNRNVGDTTLAQRQDKLHRRLRGIGRRVLRQARGKIEQIPCHVQPPSRWFQENRAANLVSEFSSVRSSRKGVMEMC